MASRTFAFSRASSSFKPRAASMTSAMRALVRFSWITPASASFCAAREAALPSDMKHCSSYERIPLTSSRRATSRSSFVSAS